MMGRKNKTGFPAHMRKDGDRGGFVVINPVSGKKLRFSPGEEQQARETAEALALWVEQRRRREAFEAGMPTVSKVITSWLEERLPLEPWDESTRETYVWRMERIRTELGESLIDGLDCRALETWLAKTAKKADPFNKWRFALVLLWRFAVAQKLAKSNEPEKIERRSTSRKIASNRKERQQLDVPGYQAIYELAEPWMRLAMDLSLLTLQSRREVCAMKHEHFRNGHLYVIRDKTAADSDMAFIRIRLTAELEALQARARTIDAIVCPYLVHRRPDRMQRRWLDGKDHWARLNEDYLTRQFAAVCERIPRFAALAERQRPTFHEIRGLGSRLHRLRGTAVEDIQALMTHSSPETTQIYLELGPGALTDDHFVKVSAPYSVSELLGAK